MFSHLEKIVRTYKLLWMLTKNEFKQKYVGNFLGVLWAFIQPTATIAIFWFVFQVGFKSQPVKNFPFILWLVAGMFPWFFFAEAVSYGTNSIVNNSFLVKKIRFQVSLLPLIPIFSSLIVHLFFVFFMYGMFLYYGYTPQLYWLQIFYYLLALILLVYGITKITAAVVVFFRDIGQIVAMLIQFGFWLTPIFWSIDMIPEKYHWIIRLNPLVYIIEGYRNSMINHKWFWQDPYMTLYYWTVTVMVLVIGNRTFKKLKAHFSDVL